MTNDQTSQAAIFVVVEGGTWNGFLGTRWGLNSKEASCRVSCALVHLLRHKQPCLMLEGPKMFS